MYRQACRETGGTQSGFTLRTYPHLMPDAADRMCRAVDTEMSGSDGPAAAQDASE
jgi:hypothetical protein